MSQSTRRAKPKKPHADLPLLPHATGRRAEKIRRPAASSTTSAPGGSSPAVLERMEALREASANRPPAKDETNARLVFITKDRKNNRWGTIPSCLARWKRAPRPYRDSCFFRDTKYACGWAKRGSDNPTAKETVKLLRNRRLHRPASAFRAPPRVREDRRRGSQRRFGPARLHGQERGKRMGVVAEY